MQEHTLLLVVRPVRPRLVAKPAASMEEEERGRGGASTHEIQIAFAYAEHSRAVDCDALGHAYKPRTLHCVGTHAGGGKGRGGVYVSNGAQCSGCSGMLRDLKRSVVLERLERRSGKNFVLQDRGKKTNVTGGLKSKRKQSNTICNS